MNNPDNYRHPDQPQQKRIEALRKIMTERNSRPKRMQSRLYESFNPIFKLLFEIIDDQNDQIGALTDNVVMMQADKASGRDAVGRDTE